MTEPYGLERSQQGVEAVLRICARRGRVVILMQDNPDPDAIGSAAVLRELIAVRLKKRAIIAYGGLCGRAENRAMLRVLRIDARRMTSHDLTPFRTVCLVDTQPHFGNNALMDNRAAHVVIDHHLTVRGVALNAEFGDVRPEYGATATILYEYARAAGLKLTPVLATALFYGVQSDTQDLGREACPADVSAYLDLFMQADKAKLSSIHRAPLPVDYFQTLHESLTSCIVAGRTVVSVIRCGHDPDTMAEVADRMLRLMGMRASVCYGICGDTIHLSARTADARSNAARKMRRVVSRLGSGGGHTTVAGGQIPIDGDPEKRLALVQARILKAFAGNKPPQPLLDVEHAPGVGEAAP